VLQYQYQSTQKDASLINRFHESMKILEGGHRGAMPPPPQMQIRDKKYPKDKIQRVASLLQMELLNPNHLPDLSDYRVIIQRDDLTIYQKENQIYFIHKRPNNPESLYFHYTTKREESYSLLLVSLVINISILSFYLYVIKRLQPLQKLKKKIIGFSQGELEVDTPQKGKDEIAEVSNEFNQAIAKIKSLQESRNLFLRNIMHELKTPIAKGKLISDLIDDTKNQKRLQTIFARFEYLLSEFTKIEQVTSNAIVLNKKRFRVVDIIDNAFDLLLIESNQLDRDINDNLEIDADFELFSTALKNLIDNALKYSSKRAKIIVETESISIESYGEALKNTHFERAFNRAFEDSSRGLGLGLYITYHIVKKHGFSLEYRHSDGRNKFIIVLPQGVQNVVY